METRDPSSNGEARELLLLRKAFEHSGEVIFLTDPQEVIIWVNPEFTRLYGYTAAEVVGKCTPAIIASEFTSAEDYERFWTEMRSRQSAKAEFVNRTKDGRLVTIEGTFNTVSDDQGRLMGYLAIQRDVSDRKLIETRLHESEELYRTLVQTSPDGIMFLSLEGEIRVCNQKAAEMCGRDSPETVVGVNLPDLMAPVDRERALRGLEHAAAGHAPPSTEYAVIGPGGLHLSAELNLSPVSDRLGQPRGLIGVLRDVTERRHLETQLAQAQKMEAIGRLAGGIAHDFNNLMTAVIGYADLLLQEPGLSEAVRQDIGSIKKAGEKATTLTRQLMIFSRKQILQPRIIDLNAVVTDTEKILRRVIGEDIRLSILLDPELGKTKADPGQLEQVLLNLAINSRDAMPQGGSITIQTQNVEMDWTLREGRFPLDPGSYVVLLFTDTGTGMDRETQARIFEPFFTTKEPGRGTGLGLSTVYGIVRQSGGHIFAQSQPGRGTTFRVYLPRVEKEPEPPVKEARETAARRHERILIVEDEEGVRSLMVKSLRAKGYSVLEARDGLEALRLLTDEGGSAPDLLITDIILPNMGGIDLAESLRVKDRRLPVLYLSGYTEQAVIRDANLGPETAFLQKPFTPEVLARTIRDLLDRDLGP